jgi:tetratricopeptide (TPR) repeat protein
MFTLAKAGHPQQGEQVYRRATGVQLEDGIPSADLAIAFGTLLIELGRMEEADRLIRRAVEEYARIGHRRGEVNGLLRLARLRCVQGPATNCEAAIRHARNAQESLERPGHGALATLKYYEGMLWMDRGELDRARLGLEQAISMFDAAQDRNQNKIRALSLLAKCLNQLGDGVRAREAAAQAVASARQSTAGLDHSEWVGNALLAQAEIHHEQGEVELARSLAAEARNHLFASLGAEAPAMRKHDSILRVIEH